MSKIVIEDFSKPETPQIVLECTLREDRPYVLGRNPANDIYLDHPSISRMHAVLFNLGGAWHLHDLGSSKGVTDPEGTLVTTRALQDGAFLSIGPTRLWFQDSGQPRVRSAPDSGDDPAFMSVLQCRLIEKDDPWAGGTDTEQVFHYCLGDRRSVTVGSGPQSDLTLPTPELADAELLLFELNDTWLFSSLSDRAVTKGDASERSGKLDQHEEYGFGPVKFSIFRANMIR